MDGMMDLQSVLDAYEHAIQLRKKMEIIERTGADLMLRMEKAGLEPQDMLSVAGGLIFATIEMFRGRDGKTEDDYPEESVTGSISGILSTIDEHGAESALLAVSVILSDLSLTKEELKAMASPEFRSMIKR
jgi:hypothetical protein